MRILIFIIQILMIAGCATKIAHPDDSVLLKMKSKVPDITLENASKGYKLYLENCAACHYLHEPENFTEGQWNTILPVMLKKLKNKDEIEKQLIKDYLISLSK